MFLEIPGPLWKRIFDAIWKFLTGNVFFAGDHNRVVNVYINTDEITVVTGRNLEDDSVPDSARDKLVRAVAKAVVRQLDKHNFSVPARRRR